MAAPSRYSGRAFSSERRADLVGDGVGCAVLASVRAAAHPSAASIGGRGPCFLIRIVFFSNPNWGACVRRLPRRQW
jgi:hypothetical protein